MQNAICTRCAYQEEIGQLVALANDERLEVSHVDERLRRVVLERVAPPQVQEHQRVGGSYSGRRHARERVQLLEAGAPPQRQLLQVGTVFDEGANRCLRDLVVVATVEGAELDEGPSETRSRLVGHARDARNVEHAYVLT